MLNVIIKTIGVLIGFLQREEDRLNAKHQDHTDAANILFVKATIAKQDANTAGNLAANISGLLK